MTIMHENNKRGDIIVVNPDTLKKTFYTPEQMQHILNRERARSDRNGRQFSLMLLEIAPKSTPVPVREIIEKIMRRVRCTDEVGWLSQNCIGIIMPDTSEPGALTVAQYMEQAFNVEIVSRIRVASYPSRESGEESPSRENYSGTID